MHPLRLLLVTVLTVAAGFSADPFLEEMGVVDAIEAGRDPELVALAAPRLVNVDKDSPAQEMGLRVGDRLVGLDGVVVVGEAEWNLVRYRHTPPPGPMQVAVLRDYRVHLLHSDRVLPIRRLGFNFSDEPTSRASALQRIGFVVPEAPDIARRFAPRAALALLRWHSHRVEAEPAAWIAGLARLFATVTAQRWQEAVALPDLAIPESCPAMRRLERYYRALATQHAAGEQPPALNGESLLYVCIHYPYPRIVLPEIGRFTHPDTQFVKQLQDRARDPWGGDGAARADALRKQRGEEDYAFHLRQAMVDPTRHGGWPHRHAEVYEREPRAKLLTRLRTAAAAGDDLSSWHAVALAHALMVDVARRENGAEPLKEVFAMAAEVQRQAPLVGYLTLSNLGGTAQFWNHDQLREAFRNLYLAGPLPDAEPPSRFLSYLREHEASLAFFRFPHDITPLARQLDLVHAALSRKDSFSALHQRLAEADLAKRPQAERLNLMAQMLDYVAGSCQSEDLQAMARLDLPGALVDAIALATHRHARKDDDVLWIRTANDLALRAAPEQAAWDRLQPRLAEIPWTRTEEVAAVIEDLRLTCGTPQVTMWLADLCEQHGRPDLASALRDRIASLFRGFGDLETMIPLGRNYRLWIEFMRFRTFSPYAATVNQALTAGERYERMLRDDSGSESAWLHLAHAHLVAGNREEALLLLGRSMAMDKEDQDAAFFASQPIIRTCRGFRTWLLGAVNERQALTPVERQRLIGASKAERVDEGFADLLGVAHKSLTGAATAPGANDF